MGVDNIGIGYGIGCLLSILAWKFDRQALIKKIDDRLSKFIRSVTLIQLFYLIIGIAISFVLTRFFHKEIYNAIVAFIVIDISSTERNNLNLKEKPDFYNTITTITRSNICGFIAPLLYVLLFGNWFALIYTLLYNFSYISKYKLFIRIWTILTIVPSMILQLVLYVIYIVKNKELYVDYKGEYIESLFSTPLLNAYILAAYVEEVNFYYYFKIKNIDYIKSYGKYNRKINYSHIKNYLSLSYFICILSLLIFLSSFIAFKTY